MRRRWSLIRLILAGAGMGYWAWVRPRAEGVYPGVSLERLRYALLSDEQRLRMTCLGSQGRQDAAQGHPRDFCVPFLNEAGLMP